MKNREALDKAINKAGGISELARILKWDKGNIARIKKTGSKHKVSPYRAAQIAGVLDRDIVAAYLEALHEQSDTEHERAFWEEQLKERKKKLKFA